LNRKVALFLLVVVIPLVYVVAAFAVVSATDVLRPRSRPTFALLYGLLALVTGIDDYYRLQYNQESKVWLSTGAFVQRASRRHAATVLFLVLGSSASFLLDIDTGWPVVLALAAGPVTQRALDVFTRTTIDTVGTVIDKSMNAFLWLLTLGVVLAAIRGM
jgi:hypothetical protein